MFEQNGNKRCKVESIKFCSGIVNKEMKKEKGIQHETFKRLLMDMSGKESHSLYDLVLSELAITWLCPSLYWT